MENVVIGDLRLFFYPEDRQAADLIGQACSKSVELIRRLWDLGFPVGCRVYVLRSWFGFVFRSASWGRRILLVLLLPFWMGRVKRTWQVAGGWALPYRPPVVGIKPPRLLQQSDGTMGEKIFISQGLHEKVQNVTCHELTHAMSGHLSLPTWLHEGLAMLTVDEYFEHPTVRADTLELLGKGPARGKNQKADLKDRAAVITLFVRGYWLTRFLHEQKPGFLVGLLKSRQPQQSLEEQVALACQLDPPSFWSNIDRLLIEHFTDRVKS